MRWLAVILLFISLNGLSQQTSDMITLQNSQLLVKVLTHAGGRIVFFGSPEGDNFLYSDPELWLKPDSRRGSPTHDLDFNSYNGFITWVGPQSEWWNHQTVNPSRSGSLWPPDPFIEFGAFRIENQSADYLRIVGVESPITGLKFTKTFELKGNRLLISVIAENCRETDVSWDLWSNIRFDAFTCFSVPVDVQSPLRIQTDDNDERTPVPYKIESGQFTFLPYIHKTKALVSKAFIYPSEACFLVKKDFGTMKISFERVDQKLIHPEQALVEVYNAVSPDASMNLLELEHHSAFKTLKPGELVNLDEVWEIIIP
jgi:hypothetical protein